MYEKRGEASTPNWQPTASLSMLKARAGMLARIRDYFSQHNVLEVETPILSRAGVTDPMLTQLVTRVQALPGEPQFYLQTSPEYPMKRLLAAYGCSIYQISKVFRDDERGRYHHTEFSLLEWYRVGWNHQQLIAELATLVRLIASQPNLALRVVSYRQLFQDYLQLDVWVAEQDALQKCAIQQGIPDAVKLRLEKDAWLDLLLSFCIQPHLGNAELTAIVDYPPSQAALARIHQQPYVAAERFELYWQGIELANGFHELSDTIEQRARFADQAAQRQRAGQANMPVDEYFLAALAAGLPDCAGVALGLDRLLMLVCGAQHIDEVLSFPLERA